MSKPKRRRPGRRPPLLASSIPRAASRNLSGLTARLTEAGSAYRGGNWARAEELCRAVLSAEAGNFDALSLLGLILAQTGRLGEAAELLARAAAVKPDNAAAHFNLGNVLRNMRRFDAALSSYERTSSINPDHVEAWHHRGVTLRELGRLDAALECFGRALELKPDHPVVHLQSGNLRQKAGRLREALADFERAIALDPGMAEGHHNRGNVLLALARPENALDSFDRALRLKPEYAEAHCGRGSALQALRRLEEALECQRRALDINPRLAAAHSHRGNAQSELRRFAEALASYDQAVAIDPLQAESWSNRGAALQELQRLDEALASYARALEINPHLASAHHNSGNALQALGRFEEAAASYARAHDLEPHRDWLAGTLLFTRLQVCDWRGLEGHVSGLLAGLQGGARTTAPFSTLICIDSPLLHRRAAELWAGRHQPSNALPALPRRSRAARIRLGYFSADYYDHPVSRLAVELFEQHDRSRFELVGLSFGPDIQDALRERICRAFDRFLDVRSNTDAEIAQLSRDAEIDIAVDLGGYTRGARSGIFAERAAPLQVNYLGYPGTTAAAHMDYIVADSTIIPPQSREHYTEKIVYLPHCYQANDRRREIADTVYSRIELGLPSTGFVFCSFNNAFKLLPGSLDSWARILRRVDDSVLWLLADHPATMQRLREESLARGLDPARLIFAPRLALPQHLARLRAAGLFLDTLPYNAHTTASDALWAGLPLLTCIGESFQARVAASLLRAIDLPELITTSRGEYEELAVDLATHPARLARLTETLRRNRSTTPLFDTQRFARGLEQAFSGMYERYHAGLAPDHIFVAP